MQTWKRDHALQCRLEYFRVTDEDDFGSEKLSITLFRSGIAECGRCIKVSLVSRSTCLTADVKTLGQHGTLAWLRQRVSVVRPTDNKNSTTSGWEKFQERLAFLIQSQWDKYV